MTTVKITSENVRESIMVRADLARPETPVQVDYLEGGGWTHCQYQSAHAQGRGGLQRIGIELFCSALQSSRDELGELRVTEIRDKVTRVTVGWDDQPGVDPGWYCQSWDGEELDGDSMKAFFPVDVDEFTQDQYVDLARALRESFPNAEIERK